MYLFTILSFDFLTSLFLFIGNKLKGKLSKTYKRTNVEIHTAITACYLFVPYCEKYM